MNWNKTDYHYEYLKETSYFFIICIVVITCLLSSSILLTLFFRLISLPFSINCLFLNKLLFHLGAKKHSNISKTIIHFSNRFSAHDFNINYGIIIKLYLWNKWSFNLDKRFIFPIMWLLTQVLYYLTIYYIKKNLYYIKGP